MTTVLWPGTYTASYVDTGPAPPEGLVAAYGFEEGTGTTASDASANAHQGTLEGGTAWTTAGKYGRALYEARALSWEEAERLRANPQERDATFNVNRIRDYANEGRRATREALELWGRDS